MTYDGKNASFIGENHVNKTPKLPCQDSSAYCITDNFAIVAVADGHSSKIRSQTGSQVAIQSAIKVIEEKLSDYKQFVTKIREQRDATIQNTIDHIWRAWQNSIFEYDVLNPLTKEEFEKTRMDQSEKDVFRRYGTTLLVGILSKEFVLVFQLGDGLAHIIYDNGEIEYLPLKDAQCDGPITTSMSDVNANEEFHYYLSIDNNEKKPIAIALCSDGFDTYVDEEGNSLAAVSIMDIFSYTTDPNYWYSYACKELEERTHKSDKDDVSLAYIYDCEADFITIYYNHFHKRFPSKLNETAEKNDVDMKISYNGYISDGIVFEQVYQITKDSEYDGMLQNGMVIKDANDSLIQSCHESASQLFSHLYQRYRPIPPDTITISWTILELLKTIRDSLNIKDLNQLFSKTELSLKLVEQKLKEYESKDNDYITLNNLNKWCKSFDLSKLESDIRLKDNQNLLSDITIDQHGNYWKNRYVIAPDDNSEYDNKEWLLTYEGRYVGDQIKKGTLYYLDNNRYEGEFENHVPHGKGKLFNEKNMIVYDGDFKNGQYDGSGELFSYGSIIDSHVVVNLKKGTFEKGRINGNNCYEYESDCDINRSILEQILDDNNIKYIGSYKEGKRNGYGESYCKMNNKLKMEFRGEYKNGRIIKGEFFIGDKGKISIIKGKLVLNKGEKGINRIYPDDDCVAEEPKPYLFDDGSMYEGDFSLRPNPIPSGKGKKYDNEGKLVYKGNFILGEYDGRGILYEYLLNGDKETYEIKRTEGIFKKGKKPKDGRETYKHSIKIKDLKEEIASGEGWQSQ